MKELIVKSSQFEANGRIPHDCAGYGDDKSPELWIEGIPEEAITLAIIMDDVDHPLFPDFNHWVAWNITPTGRIPGALPKGAIMDTPIQMEQGIAYGTHCYRGPKPPFNWNHRYRFSVYALNTTLELDSKSKKEDLLAAMKGCILAEGSLIGEYQRKPRT